MTSYVLRFVDVRLRLKKEEAYFGFPYNPCDIQIVYLISIMRDGFGFASSFFGMTTFKIPLS